MFRQINKCLIGLIFCFIPIFSWAAKIALPTALAHTLYSFENKGPFYNIDIYVKWEVQPITDTGTYAGFQFYFQNGGGGYFGTQIDSYGKKAIFSIWDADGTSMTALPLSGCVRFGHEGNGSQCIKPYEWVAGREYMIRIWVLDKNASGVNWGAWIKDTVTNEETLIGVINLKNSNGYEGYGWLTSGAIGFSEHYGYGSVDACHLLPYSKITWRGPYANNNEFMASRVESSFASTECYNSNIEGGQKPFVTVESGGGTVRKTQSGSSLWEQFGLSVVRQGNGSVRSMSGDIDCGARCSANFSSGTLVTMTAQGAAGSQFSGWGGACSGINHQCSVLMNSSRSVTAYFTTVTSSRTLTLTKEGNGKGSVTSIPSSSNLVNCQENCSGFSNSIPGDTSITLMAQPAEGSKFLGWGGYCSGTNNCNIAAGNTSVSITANFATNDGDGGVLADNVAFVKQQYLDFWGYVPDAATLNSWVNQLKSGFSTRAGIVQYLMQSDPFQGRLGSIIRLYTAYFKRLPDYEGLMYWYSNMYPTNGGQGSNLVYVSDAFANSNEFVMTYGSLDNFAFVTRVYQNVLGRSPEPGGYAYWVGRLADGMPRGEVMVGFSESAENRQASINSQLIILAYVGMLHRAPQSSEHARWLADIQAGRADALSLINALLQSSEYLARF